MCIPYQRKIEPQEHVHGNNTERSMALVEQLYRASAEAYWIKKRILEEKGVNYKIDTIANQMLQAMDLHGGELARQFHSQNRSQDRTEDDNAYQEALDKVKSIRDEVENEVNSRPS